MTRNFGLKETNGKVTEVHERVTYCSLSTSSGKQKKNRSTSQPHFRGEKILATVEGDQSLLALQQLADNKTTILQTFMTIFVKFLSCQSQSLQQRPRLTGEPRGLSCLKTFSKRASKCTINWLKMTESSTPTLSWWEIRCSHSKTLTAQGPTRNSLRDILAVFCRKYVKPQSMATAKHKFQKLDFYPANQKLVDFLDELHKLVKDAFGKTANCIIEQFIYAQITSGLYYSSSWGSRK